MVCSSFSRFGFAAGSAQQSCRIASIYPRLGYGFGYNRTGSNDNPITNGDWQYGCVCADAHVVSQSGASPKFALTAGRLAYGKQIVDEHRAMRNETIIPNSDEFTDKRVRLNSTALSDRDVALNFDERTNKTVVPDFASIQVDGLDDSDVLPKYNIANSDRPQFWRCRHLSSSSELDRFRVHWRVPEWKRHCGRVTDQSAAFAPFECIQRNVRLRLVMVR